MVSTASTHSLSRYAVQPFRSMQGIVLDEAKSLSFPLPLTAIAHQQFIHGSACGYGEEVDATVVKIWQRTAGVNVVALDDGYSPEQIAQEIVVISNTVEHIGFIGLGAMGFGMATQLIKSNYRVCGFDVYEPTLSRFAKEGGLTGKSPAEVAKALIPKLTVVTHTQEMPIAHRHAGRCPICEMAEIRWVFRCHEVNITGNKAAISSVVDQVQAQESNRGSEVALVIETLHQQIQQIAELQVECTTLKQMVASMASIHTLAFPW